MFDYHTEFMDPREAVCHWMIDNFDVLDKMIPRDYPRSLEDDPGSLAFPLSISSLFFAVLAILIVIIASVVTFVQRNRLVLKHAQVEFLCVLLAGLLLVSCGALLMALPSSDKLCLWTIWMINVGYSLELVPLIVKMAAFCRLLRAAKKMRHVRLTLRSLFGAVLILTLVVVIFLTVWSIFDPPKRYSEYKLTKEANEDGEIIVWTLSYCTSLSQAWNYAAVGWYLVLLIAATIQAFQTRTIRQEVNESQTMAIMIYSHFIFVILRLLTLLLEGTINNRDLMLVTSLIVALDAIATVNIYFVPKFLSPNVSQEESDVFLQSSTVKHLRMLAAIATSQHELRLSGRSVEKDPRQTDSAPVLEMRSQT